MKKCPNCNAEMEENANFCLYCMTSLDKKEIVVFPKRRIKKKTIIALVIAVIVALILPVLPFMGWEDGVNAENTALVADTPAGTSAPWTSAPATAYPTGTAPTALPSLSPVPTGTLIPTSSLTAEQSVAPTQVTTVIPTEVTVEPTIKPTIEPTIEPTVEPTATPTLYPTTAPTVAPTASARPTLPNTEDTTKVTYTWRTASPLDEFYPKPEEYSYIVITGVILEGESNGIFVIPENIVQNIDGTEITHTVIGVDQNAFSGTGAQEIYFPKTIHRIYSPIIPYIEQTDDPLHLYVAARNFYFDYTDNHHPEKPMLYKNFVLHCPKEALHKQNAGDLFNMDINTKYMSIANYEEWNG